MLSSHLTRKVTQLRPHSNSMAERDWNPRGPDSSPKMDASLDFPLAGLSSAPSRCLLDAEQGRRQRETVLAGRAWGGGSEEG